MTTPRVFIIRHGETEWSLSGRHTGTSELPLTSNGRKRIHSTGHALIGEDRLICPSKLAHIYVSPRKRTHETLELLLKGSKLRDCGAKTTETADLAEWDYGDYEGLTSKEIRAGRRDRGLDTDKEGGSWDIWRDGCEGGESPADVERRCDRLISEIRSNYHAPALSSNSKCGDVLLVAHGHLLRAFSMRWVGKKLDNGIAMVLEAGGVGTLSYEHQRVEEPAILLGGSFVVEIVENAEREKELELEWGKN